MNTIIRSSKIHTRIESLILPLCCSPPSMGAANKALASGRSSRPSANQEGSSSPTPRIVHCLLLKPTDASSSNCGPPLLSTFWNVFERSGPLQNVRPRRRGILPSIVVKVPNNSSNSAIHESMKMHGYMLITSELGCATTKPSWHTLENLSSSYSSQ
jgi:hypothetical protein